MMVEIAGGVVMPRREVEQQIAQALHLAHGSPGTTCCFLCRLDARVVVSALNAGAVLATVAAAVVV